MKRQVKDVLKRLFLTIHKLFIKIGIHILPVHYYTPVPNIIELERNKDEWTKKSALPGIYCDLDAQLNNLITICLPYQKEYLGNKAYREGGSEHFGPGYGYIEAQGLHAIIRHFKPRNILEVGSGVSTYCSWFASNINERETGKKALITCIEPFPSERLKAFSGIKLIQKKVQNIPFNIFNKLDSGDLLFIDSSHTVKPGSDVNFLILEVLPRLKAGVIIHFHDIYLPYDYQRNVLQTFMHWTETSLLRAFLINNNKVNIIFCLSQLHYDRKEGLSKVFPEYDPQMDISGLCDNIYDPFSPRDKHFPSSIFLQTK
jgi:hypothetical protein